jgi:hypothetical protein
MVFHHVGLIVNQSGKKNVPQVCGQRICSGGLPGAT